MQPFSNADELEREIAATTFLMLQGWTPRGKWIFTGPSLGVHDMSAADLSQHVRIDREQLFSVSADANCTQPQAV